MADRRDPQQNRFKQTRTWTPKKRPTPIHQRGSPDLIAVSCTLLKDMIEAIDTYAATVQRSRSWVLRKAIEVFLKEVTGERAAMVVREYELEEDEERRRAYLATLHQAEPSSESETRVEEPKGKRHDVQRR